MKIHISNGNSKIGKIPNFSIRPVLDCPNCSACAKKCYARKAYNMYPSTKKAWNDNSKAIRSGSSWVFEVIGYVLKRKPAYFRIHVAGDFIDQVYLDRWMIIARACPETQFLAFTKSHHLDFNRRPDNLTVIFSMFPAMPTPRKGFPIAWVQDGTERRIPSDAQKCSGACDSCGICWHLKAGQSVYFDIH